MVVIVVENAPEKLRGEMTRWLLEVKPGVFVGQVSATVREKLWQKISKDGHLIGALLIFSSDTEQGFFINLFGDPRRTIEDIDGIQLVKIQ